MRAPLDAPAGGRPHYPRRTTEIVSTDSRRREYHMGVAVDESRHHHSPRRADFHRVPGGSQVFHPPGRPHLLDDAVADQERPVLNYSQVLKFSPVTGTSGAAHRDELPGIPDQSLARLLLSTHTLTLVIVPTKRSKITDFYGAAAVSIRN